MYLENNLHIPLSVIYYHDYNLVLSVLKAVEGYNSLTLYLFNSLPNDKILD